MELEREVLVTGGAGFIGSHTVVELLQSNYKVIVLDNLSNAAAGKSNVKPYFPPSLRRVLSIVPEKVQNNLTFVLGSYADENTLDEIFSRHKIEAVIHFGGYKAVGESKEVPLKYYENNLTGSLNLLKCMKKHNIFNMIFSSSATVYSEVAPDELPYTEDSITGNCTCAYANTKYFLETIFEDTCNSDNNWKIMSLRYFNPVGAHPSGKIGEDPKGIPFNLMPFIAQVAVGRREKLMVFGDDYPTIDGTGVRDYLHVVDLSKGHVKALQAMFEGRMKSNFRCYNLGTGRGTSVLEMVATFEQVTGKKLNVEVVGRREGDVAAMYCDATRSKQELGWQCELGLKEMCQHLWKFQAANPDGYNHDE